MKHGKVNKPVLHGSIETLHIVHIAILIWLNVWEITFHTFHTSQNMVHALWLVKIDDGSDVMNRTSHRVYQTGEGGKRKGPRKNLGTSENQATPCKVIQDSLGSWIPWIGFRIPCQWNLNSRFQSLPVIPDSEALVLNLQAKNSRIRDRKTVFPGFRSSTSLKWGHLSLSFQELLKHDDRGFKHEFHPTEYHQQLSILQMAVSIYGLWGYHVFRFDHRFFRQRVHYSCPSTTRAPYEEYHATYGEFSPRRSVHYRVWLPSDHRKQPKRWFVIPREPIVCLVWFC